MSMQADPIRHPHQSPQYADLCCARSRTNLVLVAGRDFKLHPVQRQGHRFHDPDAPVKVGPHHRQLLQVLVTPPGGTQVLEQRLDEVRSPAEQTTNNILLPDAESRLAKFHAVTVLQCETTRVVNSTKAQCNNTATKNAPSWLRHAHWFLL